MPAGRSRSAVGLLRLLLVASALVPLVLMLADGWISLVSVREQMEQDLRRVCDIAREHAAKVFNSQELAALRADDRLGDMDDAAIRRSERVLHDTFVSMVDSLPQVGSMVILDSAGRLLVASGAWPVDRSIDFSDRDYYRALKGGARGTVLSGVHVSRVTGNAFFSLAHRLDDPQGGFGGVVSIAVPPSFFVSFWTTLATSLPGGGEGRTIALLRDDGKVLALWPGSTTPDSEAGPAFHAAVDGGADAGLFAGGPLYFAGERQWSYAFCRVRGYPAFALAGGSRGAVRGLWLATMRGHLAIGLPATLVLYLITWTALQRARREQAALAQMRAEMQRRETAEAALMQAQRMEALGQLTGGVAHDFNNLLTIIMGNFEMIGRDPDMKERTGRLVQAGIAAAERGADVTAKLLAFSRRRMVRPEVADVNQLLREFRPVLRQGVTDAVTLEFDFGVGPYCAALDRGQLESAVLNLVTNARDAMPQGGTIRIRTDALQVAESDGTRPQEVGPGDYVRVQVADDGSGMEPAVVRRAFEPFFTTKEVGRGTGLGLSQVYGFCLQAGGFARIHSVPHEGTTVELLFPRVAAAAVAQRPVAAVAPSEDAAGRTVLVVEDEGEVREVAVANLRTLGYVTLTAPDAAGALSVLRGGETVDILFSDIVMPGGIDGVELGHAARALRPDIVVVLTSGYPGPNADRSAPDGTRILAKPYSRRDLAAALAG